MESHISILFYIPPPGDPGTGKSGIFQGWKTGFRPCCFIPVRPGCAGILLQ